MATNACTDGTPSAGHGPLGLCPPTKAMLLSHGIPSESHRQPKFTSYFHHALCHTTHNATGPLLPINTTHPHTPHQHHPPSHSPSTPPTLALPINTTHPRTAHQHHPPSHCTAAHSGTWSVEASWATITTKRLRPLLSPPPRRVARSHPSSAGDCWASLDKYEAICLRFTLPFGG